MNIKKPSPPTLIRFLRHVAHARDRPTAAGRTILKSKDWDADLSSTQRRVSTIVSLVMTP
jgi:hypothetical protein